jgi:hypothetical protein
MLKWQADPNAEHQNFSMKFLERGEFQIGEELC